MKNACEVCRYKKDKPTGLYCVKYGIVRYQPRTFCVAFERDAYKAWGENEQVQKPENGDRWNQVR